MSGVTVVTGGAGFIGSHLVRLLVERGERVRVVDRASAKLNHLPLSQIDVVAADIRGRERVRRAVCGCGTVYHLAANPHCGPAAVSSTRSITSARSRPD